jgi:hypothetical protein
MAGSRKDFIVTDDAGQRFSVNVDESNAKATIRRTGDAAAVGIRLFDVPTAPFPGRPPASFRLRGVNTFNAADPRETRFFKVGNPAAYALALGGPSEITAFRVSPGGGAVAVTWVVRSGRPERRGTQPNFSQDTGLDDGTPAGND